MEDRKINFKDFLTSYKDNMTVINNDEATIFMVSLYLHTFIKIREYGKDTYKYKYVCIPLNHHNEEIRSTKPEWFTQKEYDFIMTYNK